MLKSFTYPAAAVTSDLGATNNLYGFTAETFEEYIWGKKDKETGEFVTDEEGNVVNKGLLATLSEPILNVLEYIEQAKERRTLLGQEIAEARAAVDGINLSRFNDDDDDDDDDDVVPAAPGGFVTYAGTGSTTLLPVAGFDDAGTTGVLGARTGGRSRGVAGVRVEDQGAEGAAADNKQQSVASADDSKNAKNASSKGNKLVKVENNEVPLAATPFKEDPVNPAIVGISIAALLAVLAGLYYEFNRRKKAKAEEMKKYKKN